MKYEEQGIHNLHSSFLLSDDTFVLAGVVGFRSLSNINSAPTLVVTGLKGKKHFIGFNSIPGFLYNLRNITQMENSRIPDLHFSVSGNLNFRVQKLLNVHGLHSYRLLLVSVGQHNSGITLARSKDIDLLKGQIAKLADWVEKCIESVKDKIVSNDSQIESIISNIQPDFESHLAFHSNKAGLFYAICKRKNKNGYVYAICSDTDMLFFKDDQNSKKFKCLLNELKLIDSLKPYEDHLVNTQIDKENNFYVRGTMNPDSSDKIIKINCDDFPYTSTLLLRETPKIHPLKPLIAKMEEMLK